MWIRHGRPTREIVWLSCNSSWTVARTLQRLGIKRNKHELLQYPSPWKRPANRLMRILTQHYALDEVLLGSLHQLARGNASHLKSSLPDPGACLTLPLCHSYLSCQWPADPSFQSKRPLLSCLHKAKQEGPGGNR